MKLLRLKNTSDTYFKEAWRLYEDAFPIEERRFIEDQSLVLENEMYHFEVLIEKKQFMGFILWWDLDTCRYIDHFATATKHRNKGLGKLVLNIFIDKEDKPIILEVELPTCKLNERRIKFYEKVGFKLNLHSYKMPPLRKDQSALQLLLMTYPSSISKKDTDLFAQKYHPIIFKNNL
ncbi:GNAT family N-acetyltransferase [Polaribacter atrinae]|uniref:N-acetyltransferase domain-containing protein n=1 Tax=Polaribacter atrinae TaxID=1333662 RepID=A0A176TBR7_9FLAO|nr:GNAT family N-acetyltransferase [Polaribacter atrinae]OAD45111.1 hypothetical protein LPB303_09245 [Polaribacter atrinae]